MVQIRLVLQERRKIHQLQRVTAVKDSKAAHYLQGVSNAPQFDVLQ